MTIESCVDENIVYPYRDNVLDHDSSLEQDDVDVAKKESSYEAFFTPQKPVEQGKLFVTRLDLNYSTSFKYE